MSDEQEFLQTLRQWIETSTHRSMHAFIRYKRESKLSLSQVNTLFRLYHHGASPVNDLAAHLGVTMAAASQLLNQLIDAGYILRSTDPSDRRVKLIELTPSGATAVEKSIQSRHAWVDDLAEQFTASEIKAVFPALKLLNERTRELLLKQDPRCVQETIDSLNPETKA
jgi:DNA-binding MarR family transcriptional regulator